MAELRFGSLSYIENTVASKCNAAWFLELLKSGQRGQSNRQRLARRDVVVAVGGRPIMPVEQVFDIELHAPVLVDVSVQSRIETNEAGQPHRIVRRRKGIREIDYPGGDRPL